MVFYIALCTLVLAAQRWCMWHLSRQRHAKNIVDDQDIDPEIDHSPVEIYSNPVALQKKSDGEDRKVTFFRGVRNYSEANVAARTKFVSRVTKSKEDPKPDTSEEPGMLSDSDQLARGESSDLQQKLVDVLVKRGIKREKRIARSMQQAQNGNKTPTKTPQVPVTTKAHEADQNAVLDL